jgi:hypothetical protein
MAPNRLVFGLNLLPARMGGEVNAEPAQAGKPALDSLRVFALHDLQLDLQVVNGRLLDVRGGVLQQRADTARGAVDVTA